MKITTEQDQAKVNKIAIDIMKEIKSEWASQITPTGMSIVETRLLEAMQKLMAQIDGSFSK